MASMTLCAEPSTAFETETQVTAEAVLLATGVAPDDTALLRSKILFDSRPDMEKTRAELAVNTLLWVPHPLPATIEVLRENVSLRSSGGSFTSREIPVESLSIEVQNVFESVVFTANEYVEVERLMALQAGRVFNFSADEIRKFNSAAEQLRQQKKSAAALHAANTLSTVYRRVLEQRFKAYRLGGLNAIKPYQLAHGRQVFPGAELIVAAESLHLLRHRFRNFYQAFRFYPQHASPDYEQRFFWVKEEVRGRPVFILKHWMVDHSTEHLLLAERRYYVGHTYNSMQMVILGLPYHNGTLIVLLNQTFTELIKGAASEIRHEVGRWKIHQAVRPFFEKLQEHLKK